jgi:hypothetical protein
VIFPIVPDGSIHRVDIALGADVGPRYRAFALESAQ